MPPRTPDEILADLGVGGDQPGPAGGLPPVPGFSQSILSQPTAPQTGLPPLQRPGTSAVAQQNQRMLEEARSGQRSPLPTNISVLEEAARSVGRVPGQLVEGAGGILQILGTGLAAVTPLTAGQASSLGLEVAEFGQSIQPLPSKAAVEAGQEGYIESITSPKWWASVVPGEIANLGLSFLGGLGVGSAAGRAAAALGRTATAVSRAQKVGRFGAWAAPTALREGGVSAVRSFERGIAEGLSEDEAAVQAAGVGGLTTAATTALEFIPLAGFLTKTLDGGGRILMNNLVNRVHTSTLLREGFVEEGLTEVLQGVSADTVQAFIEQDPTAFEDGLDRYLKALTVGGLLGAAANVTLDKFSSLTRAQRAEKAEELLETQVRQPLLDAGFDTGFVEDLVARRREELLEFSLMSRDDPGMQQELRKVAEDLLSGEVHRDSRDREAGFKLGAAGEQLDLGFEEEPSLFAQRRESPQEPTRDPGREPAQSDRPESLDFDRRQLVIAEGVARDEARRLVREGEYESEEEAFRDVVGPILRVIRESEQEPEPDATQERELPEGLEAVQPAVQSTGQRTRAQPRPEPEQADEAPAEEAPAEEDLTEPTEGDPTDRIIEIREALEEAQARLEAAEDEGEAQLALEEVVLWENRLEEARTEEAVDPSALTRPEEVDTGTHYSDTFDGFGPAEFPEGASETELLATLEELEADLAEREAEVASLSKDADPREREIAEEGLREVRARRDEVADQVSRVLGEASEEGAAEEPEEGVADEPTLDSAVEEAASAVGESTMSTPTEIAARTTPARSTLEKEIRDIGTLLGLKVGFSEDLIPAFGARPTGNSAILLQKGNGFRNLTSLLAHDIDRAGESDLPIPTMERILANDERAVRELRKNPFGVERVKEAARTRLDRVREAVRAGKLDLRKLVQTSRRTGKNPLQALRDRIQAEGELVTKVTPQVDREFGQGSVTFDAVLQQVINPDTPLTSTQKGAVRRVTDLESQRKMVRLAQQQVRETGQLDGSLANALVASKIGPIRKFAHRIITGRGDRRAQDEQKVNELTMVGMYEFWRILTSGRASIRAEQAAGFEPGQLRRLKLMTLRTEGEADPLGVILPANLKAGQNSTVFKAMTDAFRGEITPRDPATGTEGTTVQINAPDNPTLDQRVGEAVGLDRTARTVEVELGDGETVRVRLTQVLPWIPSSHDTQVQESGIDPTQGWEESRDSLQTQREASEEVDSALIGPENEPDRPTSLAGLVEAYREGRLHPDQEQNLTVARALARDFLEQTRTAALREQGLDQDQLEEQMDENEERFGVRTVLPPSLLDDEGRLTERAFNAVLNQC